MPDTLSPARRHANMAAIHSCGTGPEVTLRHALWRKGFRYRINDRRLPGSPDIVLPRYRTAIFVHGCFWHGHKDCKNYTVPKTNTDFWVAKVLRNQERDQDAWRRLEAKGWGVIIVWECELEKTKLDKTLETVVSDLRRNGELYRSVQDGRKESRALYREERRSRKERELLLEEEISHRFVHR